MATNWTDVTTVGGDLQIFNNPATQPDYFAHGGLVRPQIAAGADMLLWRSAPIFGGTNTNAFKVIELRGWVKQFAGPVNNNIPNILKPGWSRFSMGNVGAASQKDLNVFFSIGYMQYPLVGHPTPTAFAPINADPGQPQGFHYWDNPIGAQIPAPVTPGVSCWVVVIAMDSAARLGFAGSNPTFEFKMSITGANLPEVFGVQNP